MPHIKILGYKGKGHEKREREGMKDGVREAVIHEGRRQRASQG